MHQPPTEPVPVGTPVWFLPTGQEHDKALPATVIEMSPSLVARISFIDPDGGMNTRLSCHPLGSKALKDEMGRPTIMAARYGAWTYNPWFMPRKKTSKSSN